MTASSIEDSRLALSKSDSVQSTSSGEIDYTKPANKAALKHISQSSLEVDESVVRAEGEERTTAFVWWLVIAAATGGLLFGYDVRLVRRPCSCTRREDLTAYLPTDRCHRRRSRAQGYQPRPASLPSQLWQQRGQSR